MMAGRGHPKPQTYATDGNANPGQSGTRCAPKIHVTSAVKHRLYIRATSETRSMITSRQLAPLLVLAALPLIGACQRHEANTSAAAPAAAATTAAAAAPQTVLGKTVDSALRKARDELEKGNIDISRGVDVQMGEHGEKHFAIGAGHGDGKAEITPAGDLLLQGKPATITPAQRALLLQYRQQIISVAETGMAIGVKGADLAGKALAETFSGLMHGDADQAGKRIEAEGKKLEADAYQICTQLPGLMQTQQQLAAALPDFKPYATMTQKDVDDCGKHGAAVTSR